VIGKQYLARQAATLLRYAQSIHDPQTAAALVDKATKLRDQIDRSAPFRESLAAPDVETPAR
jgi:hypothetical protein